MPTQLILPGDAGFGDVLAGKKFSAGTNYNATGTMPNNGAVTLTPSGNGTVPIPAGYHDGSGYVQQVNVSPGTLLTGYSVAGVAGTMPNLGTAIFTPGTVEQTSRAGYYSEVGVKGDPNLIASNILAGANIFGVSGSVLPAYSASGTAGSYTSETFSMIEPPQTQSRPYLQVNGLSFQPKVIIIKSPLNSTTSSSTDMTIYNVNQFYCADTNGQRGTANVWAEGMNIGVIVSDGVMTTTQSGYVNNGGFMLPVLNSAFLYAWDAFA